MTKDAKVHNDIYLFVIGNGKNGYAEFRSVYKRPDPATHDKALEEIQNISELSKWTDVTGICAAGGLDMRFTSAQDSLIFVQINNELHSSEEGLRHTSQTYFGKEVVSDLVVPNGPKVKTVSNCKLHGLDNKPPQLCSFELGIQTALNALQSQSGDDPITRFPVMFNFVDSGDNRSPVYKKPHKQNKIDPRQPAIILGHGGIHPPNASSIIMLD